jgi:hypothetical protein
LGTSARLPGNVWNGFGWIPEMCASTSAFAGVTGDNPGENMFMEGSYAIALHQRGGRPNRKVRCQAGMTAATGVAARMDTPPAWGKRSIVEPVCVTARLLDAEHAAYE